MGFRRTLILLSLALAGSASAATDATVPGSTPDPPAAHAVSSWPGLARLAPAGAPAPIDTRDAVLDPLHSATDSIVPASTGAVDGDDLGPTSEAPWSPPRPMAASEPWETALRLPGRIVTIPFTLLGRTVRRSLILVEETSAIPQVLALIALHQRFGLYLTTANLGDRTGLGGAARLAPPPLGGHLAGELSASTGQYNRARVVASAGPARLAYQYEWRSRDQFFGLGADGREDLVSTYASRIQRAEAALGWSWGEPRGPRTEAAAWIGPRDMVQRDGRDPKKRGILERFPSLAASLLDVHVEHLVYGARLSHDRRGGAPHWSHGWRLAGAAERFDTPIEALAIRDAGTPAVQFTRLSAEAEGGVSFMRDPRTLRLALRAVNHDGADGPGVFMLGDLAHLGGHQGLAGFEPGRFHGVDLVAGKLSYIFPLAKHFEFDVHVEAGNVYDRLRDARFDTLEHSYGVALRPRLETAPLGVIGVDWSDESVRVRYSVGGVQ